jgi:hypothetical protein
MQAFRVKQRIDSETLHLPELRPLVGRQVEIIVLCLDDECRAELASTQFPLRGSVQRYDAPFEPAVTAGAWEAAR